MSLVNSFLVVEPTKILEGRCEGKENVKAAKVWAGNYNTFVVDTEGILWACGSNGFGTLGQGNTNIYNKWVKIDYINGKEIQEIQVSHGVAQSAAIIIMKDKTVYGGGYTVSLGLSGTNKTKFIQIDEYSNVKQIEMAGVQLYYINQSNDLYVVGFNVQSNVVNTTISNPVKIFENVKNVKVSGGIILFIDEQNNLYRYYKGESTKVSGITANDTTILLNGISVLNNNEYYSIDNTGKATKLKDNVQPYYNNYDGNQILQNRNVSVINSNKKIYIKGAPNITKIGEKSNYNLRKVFENAVFVQGKGNNISIADKNGKVYESASAKANEKIENARKIVASSSSKYVIKNDGTLWAKGHEYTGMWGEIISKNEYTQITEDGSTPFTNVKDIFTSKRGNSAIFITNNDEIYWAGSDSYIILPQIKGDYKIEGSGYITYYPKEVTSEMLNKIKNRIKDISYSFMNSGGILGNNTLILTEDGKLYTMATNSNMSGNNHKITGDFEELTIKEGTTVKQILTQEGLSLALLSNGEVYGWGYNTYGILGQNYEIGGTYPIPVKLEGLPANIRYMSLGNGFAIFASKSEEVYGIGKNDYGQLGTGDNIGRTEFVRCSNLEE